MKKFIATLIALTITILISGKTQAKPKSAFKLIKSTNYSEEGLISSVPFIEFIGEPTMVVSEFSAGKIQPISTSRIKLSAKTPKWVTASINVNGGAYGHNTHHQAYRMKGLLSENNSLIWSNQHVNKFNLNLKQLWFAGHSEEKIGGRKEKIYFPLIINDQEADHFTLRVKFKVHLKELHLSAWPVNQADGRVTKKGYVHIKIKDDFLPKLNPINLPINDIKISGLIRVELGWRELDGMIGATSLFLYKPSLK